MSRFLNGKLKSVTVFTLGISGACLLNKVYSKKTLCEKHNNSSTPSKTRHRGGIESTVGNTPLIYLQSISEETGCHIYGKAEFLNPTGSVKDRAAKQILDEAEAAGLLKPGGTIVEATGGNTGIALAQFGIARGYQVVVFLPNCIGLEKIEYERRFGATVHLQPLVPFTHPDNFCKKAESYALENNAFNCNQFENQANFRSHYEGTGKEIWNALKGQIDGFVTSAGTGGTIAGVSKFLKEQNPKILCYLVDPHCSVLYNYVNTGKVELSSGNTTIEGIGIGRITSNFKQAQLDKAVQCEDIEAIEMSYYLMRNEGIC